MSAMKAFAPLLTRTPQVWIRGRLWHATRLSCRIPVEVLVDTGAGGGNYTSLNFTKTVQTNLWGGRALINPAGKGSLRAANPKDSAVPPMEVIGSCVIPMMFSPVDKVFRISFRVVRDLPYAIVLGAAFMREHHSIISFREKEGFKPTPESTWVSFSSHTTNSATSSKKVTAAWTSFCAVRPIADSDPDPDNPQHIPRCLAEANEDSLDQVVDHLHSVCWETKERRRSHAATANAKRNAPHKLERKRQQATTEMTIGTEEEPAPTSQSPPEQPPEKDLPYPDQTDTDNPTAAGEAVWEDEGTLDWVLRLTEAVSALPGGTSVQVDARVKGPQPQTRLLVIVEPRERFNLKRGVDIGVPRGIQWWEPGNPLKCKVTNVATRPISISKGVPVAIVYSVNNFDTPRIQSLLKPIPLPQICTEDKKETARGPEKSAESLEQPRQGNLDEANIGQLSPTEKEALMEVLKEYTDVFAANPKAVAACKGPPMRLELKDPNSAPFVTPMRHYTPEQRKMIQAEIEKLYKAGAIVPSTSQYASCCHTVRKKDGTVRVVQDFRGLNALLKAQSGGLGDLLTIYDEMDQAAYFSCLDLASGFLQLTIHEADRHLTAFRDAEGKLWEYVRCGFGLKTVPSAFANYVGGSIMDVKKKGVRNWLDDMIIPTRTFEQQLELLRETFDCLRRGKLSVNLPKSEFCFSVVEWLGMVIDRFGVRPAPSKIEAITQLSQPSTVEEVRVLLGMAGYLRKFVPNYSSILAPISDLLRDPRFRTKKARRVKVPWGQAQTEAMETLVNLLTSPPILALPDWNKPFRLHTDASETGAGAVLTQVQDMVEKTLAYASHRWSKTDEKKSPTDRECLAVLWAVDKFASYLQARPFTLITDCAALTWLFKSQALSAKYHRWALRLMQYDMDLQWRPGSKHQFADALSRSRSHDTRGNTVDDSFPGDNTTKGTYRGPLGPVLDGIPLGRLGIEGVNNNEALPLTVLAAVTFTPNLLPTDTNSVGQRSRAHSLDSAPTLPKAVVIGCGGGSSIRALNDIFDFTGITDHDWRALECARLNGKTTNSQFKRMCLEDPEYVPWIKSRKPEAIIGNTSRRANELEEGRQGTTGTAANIVHAFISSRAHFLIIESTQYLLKSANWTDDLSPLLSTAGCCWEAVELSSQQVGVPSTKKKTFIACIRNRPNAEERLTRWKARLTDMKAQPTTLGEFIGREGSYFLNRKKGEQKIFSFEGPILSLTRSHIPGEKPPPSSY